jgi:hypothetical protein
MAINATAVASSPMAWPDAAPCRTSIGPTLTCWLGALIVIFSITVITVEVLTREWRNIRGSQGSRASLLLGFEAACLSSNAYLAVAGVLAWYPPAPFFVGAELAADHMLFVEVPYVVHHILCPMMAHVLADVVLALALPEIREPALIVHHFLTMALAVLALRPVPFAHYYDIFFAGVCELSNVPLAVMEAFKTMPAARPMYPRLYQRASSLFTLSFVVLRLVYWPLVSWRFWAATLAALRAGVPHADASALIFYLVANGCLTALQVGWGAKLLRGHLRRMARAKGE